MTYPLTVPMASHSANPITMITPFPQVTELSAPTRNWHRLTVPVNARSVRITVNTPLVQLAAEVGKPPTRTWAPLSVYSQFTFPTYGQWLSRAARDRP